MAVQLVKGRTLMPDDHNDRTSLDLLVQRLFDRGQEPSTSGSAAALKKAKLSGFGTKPNLGLPPSSRLDTTSNGQNNKPAMSNQKADTEEDNKKQDMKLPSLQITLAERAQIEKDVKHVEDIFHNLKSLPEHVNYEVGKTRTYKLHLDCKHLHEADIKFACAQNTQYMEDIHTGKRFCKRYDQYRKNYAQNKRKRSDLTYNTSMIAFTFVQKQWMLAFLDEKFGEDMVYMSKNHDYLFKVLLPELCFKIFMDVYNMDEADAVHYLDKQPLPK